MKPLCLFQLALLGLLFCAGMSSAQPAPARAQRDPIFEKIEKDGCAVTEDGKVKVCKADYKFRNQLVEALTFRPTAEGKFPSVMLIPGYTGTAHTYFMPGTVLARMGFASLSVGTPGFGKTDLKPDFIGPNTVKAYLEGYEQFKREPFVDKHKLGLLGYSRGAIAASLLATKVKDLKAAVLGGGIYHLQQAYDELTIEGIKDNIKAETGLSEQGFKERSVVFHVDKINVPVLIVHGEKDLNAPASQAYLLRNKLKAAGRKFEFHILAGRNHGNAGGQFLSLAVDFLSRQLKGVPADVKFR